MRSDGRLCGLGLWAAISVRGRIEACAPVILQRCRQASQTSPWSNSCDLLARAWGRCRGVDAVALLRPAEDHAQKKSGHAAEQDRPDVLRRRRAWFEGQLDLDPERLVFIDETGASTKMARLHGRAPRGQRLRASIPHGHWKTTTFVGALRLTGMTAPMVLDGPMNGAWFLSYVEQVLVPTLTALATS